MSSRAERDRRGQDQARPERRGGHRVALVGLGGEPRQARGRRQLHDRARSAAQEAAARSAARADPRACAGSRSQPPAAAIASSVPSPPSASGTRRIASSGSGAAASRSRAPCATSTEVERALERIGRDQDRTRELRPASVDPRLPGARRTRGCGSSAAAPASASSITSSDRRFGRRARQLHGRAELGEQTRLAPLLEPLHDRLEDRRSSSATGLRAPGCGGSRMSRSTWPKPLSPKPLGKVDEVADLDRIAREERDLLEVLAPAGVLAGERLDVARQLGEEEVDQRPRHELGDAAAAALLEQPALDDRALVVGLDVADARLGRAAGRASRRGSAGASPGCPCRTRR